MASTLVVLKFEEPEGAERGLEIAVDLQKQHLLEIEDAAIVSWPQGKKRPKTRHGAGACGGAWLGAFWGMLFGWIFFVPFLGAAFGAAMGAISATFADYGIGNEFLERVRSQVTEGTSALFLLTEQATTDRVVEAFKNAPKFEIIATNLSHEQEAKLKEAFAH